MTTSTKQVLNAIRATGLTARSGCHPTSAKEFCNVEYLEGKVINLCAFSVLGVGQWNHPDRDKTLDEMAAKVETALTKIGVEFRRASFPGATRASDMFFINGYRA